MKLVVTEIPEEGLNLTISGDGRWLRTFFSPREKEETVRVRDSFSVEVRISRVDEVIRVAGCAKIPVELRCVRCNEWFISEVDVEVKSEFHPLSEWVARGKEEIELKASEMEMEFYSSRVIDIDEVVAESIFLSLPSYPVCTDDCKGLCARCGANLNKGKCQCSADQPVDDWKKALEDLRSKLKIK